jgi:DNA replication and repair protein RecF
VKFDTLKITRLRCIQEMAVRLSPGINVFSGANGAGKTTILEAAYVLSHANSFRAGTRENLVSRGQTTASIFAELVSADGGRHRLGFGKEGGRWAARVDGENAVSLGAMVQQCAVVCFEPGSHALIAGASDERRRYLDWGVFHVEHDFLNAWRRYQRALKQRNVVLRSGSPTGAALDPWERELSLNALLIDSFRESYVAMLRPHLRAFLSALLPELGAINFRYRRGWADDADLDSALFERRDRDISRGHTTIGPHRADWSLAFEHAPLREHLSRGQEKLCALACVLAQAALFAERRGEWPIICMDDLASELDRTHQQWVVEQLQNRDAQVLITGTDVPAALATGQAMMFHVEQGSVTALL